MPAWLCPVMLLLAPVSAQLDGPPPSADIVLGRLDQGLDTHLILGNGNLLAFVEVADDALIIGTSMNDVWDIRLDTSQDKPLVPLADIEATALHGRDGLPPQPALEAMVRRHTTGDSYQAHPYPCPRMTARWVVPLDGRKVTGARIHLAEGRAVITLEGGRIEVYVDARTDVVVAEVWLDTPDGTKSVAPRLEPVADPGIIPPAETGTTGGADWLVQQLPDDVDMPGIDFAVASTHDGDRYILSHASSHTHSEPLETALAQARTVLAESADTARAAQAAHWNRFWSRSAIALADDELTHLWYRQLYFLGCAIRPDAPAPGLFAPITNNAPAWHGDYHTNYNIQQTFWPVLATNHVEWMAPYDRLVAEYLPRAQWLARTLYGVDGAFYPHVIMFNEPPPNACKAVNNRQYIHIEWAYTLGVTAFTVQNLWWRYEFAPDREYLANTAYPVLREVAEFYTGVLARYRGDDGYSRPPTMSPEHWGWTPGLERNRNCTFDTALIAFSLKAAIRAAEILGVDTAKAETWREALTWLPPYPTHGDPPLLVDVDGAPPTRYNIPIPSTVVFPGEQVHRRSDPALRDLVSRTVAGMESNGNNDLVINAMARARLGMPDAYDYLRREALARLRPNGTLTLNRNTPEHRFNAFGHYTEMYGAAAAVCELLIQSHDGIIDVFPAWPRDQDAAFRTLRAKGGFLVSARLLDGAIEPIEIVSTAGGTCRIAAPWPKARLNGTPHAPDGNGLVAFPTEPGGTYRLEPGAG